MDYNPYNTRYESLYRSVSISEKEKATYLERLAWYDSFDADATHAAVCAGKREEKTLMQSHDAASKDYTAERIGLDALREAASLGWDPRNWFSSARREKVKVLEAKEARLSGLKLRQDELQRQINAKNGCIRTQESELERYRNFDKLCEESALRALEFKLESLKADFSAARSLKDKFDEKNKALLAELLALEERRAILQADISEAESFEQRLSAAANPHERWNIHEECKARFNDGSPKQVIRSKSGELEPVDRTIKKLDKRLRELAQHASRNIETIVIDGNNLCHAQGVFIGLRALIPVAQDLAKRYRVQVVFDPSIRGLLKMHDRDIARALGDNLKVHIVAKGDEADETILDVAAPENYCVLSNDIFRDFPDKPAVSQQRVVRHKILDGRILIHELDVNETLLSCG